MNETQTETGEVLPPVACSIFDMEHCPHCKGTGGFIYRLTIRGDQFQPWKNSEGNPHFEDLSGKHGAYRCDDCGKIIKSNLEVSERP